MPNLVDDVLLGKDPAGPKLIGRIIRCIVNPTEYYPEPPNAKFTTYHIYEFYTKMKDIDIHTHTLEEGMHEYGLYVMFSAEHDQFSIDVSSSGINGGRFYLYTVINGNIHYTKMTNCHIFPDDKYTISVSEPILVTLTYMVDLFNRNKGEFYSIVTNFPDEMMSLFNT